MRPCALTVLPSVTSRSEAATPRMQLSDSLTCAVSGTWSRSTWSALPTVCLLEFREAGMVMGLQQAFLLPTRRCFDSQHPHLVNILRQCRARIRIHSQIPGIRLQYTGGLITSQHRCRHLASHCKALTSDPTARYQGTRSVSHSSLATLASEHWDHDICY